jgi:Family of unknown function (DUF6464)
MMEVFFILAIALIPTLLTLVLRHRMEQQARARLRSAMAAAERRQLRRLLTLPIDHQYIEGVGALIGDFTCLYNARSPHVRCAVNPFGPCKDCPYYEATKS